MNFVNKEKEIAGMIIYYAEFDFIHPNPCRQVFSG